VAAIELRIVLRTLALGPPDAPARALSASARAANPRGAPRRTLRERSGSPPRYGFRRTTFNGVLRTASACGFPPFALVTDW